MEEIRRYQRLGVRPEEIAGQLGVSRATLYRYMKTIKQEDLEYVRTLATGELASSVVLTIESLEDIYRQLIVMSRDPKIPARTRIRALELMSSLDIELLNLKLLGPRAEPK